MYLRAYKDADFETVYALDRDCFPPRFRFSRAMMRRVVEACGAVVLLACEVGVEGDEVMLGFGAAEVEEAEGSPPRGYVATLDVELESRRRGVARMLMRGLEDAVADAGATVMELHVHVGNEGALTFYEGLGYRQVDLEADFYGKGVGARVYRKGLTVRVS